MKKGRERYIQRYIIGISVIAIAAIILLTDMHSKEKKRRLEKALIKYDRQKKLAVVICDMEIQEES